jgi:AraC-like DNA-binding protein
MPVTDSFADRVRSCIVELLPSGGPGIEDVAAELKMSARTVRRRLRDESTTYRDILDDLRHALALQQLGPLGLSVEEVAYRLGFADASGFHKAFRRWAGESPADYARKRSGGG